MNLKDWSRIYLIVNSNSLDTEPVMLVSRPDVKQLTGLSYEIEDRDGLIILMAPMKFDNIEWIQLK